MSKVKVTLVKSLINRPERQKRTAKALGLTKMQSVVEKDLNPQIQGMIDTIAHLIRVEQL
jgi:large subunit ribosomal protein L30